MHANHTVIRTPHVRKHFDTVPEVNLDTNLKAEAEPSAPTKKLDVGRSQDKVRTHRTRKTSPAVCARADRFVMARSMRELTQMDLAKLSGVSREAIISVERGITDQIRYKTLCNLSKALGVTPAWLQRGQGEGPQPIEEWNDRVVTLPAPFSEASKLPMILPEQAFAMAAAISRLPGISVADPSILAGYLRTVRVFDHAEILARGFDGSLPAKAEIAA